MEIPKGVVQMRNELHEVKELLRRLDKGQKFIEDSIKSGSIVKAHQGVELFNKLANRLNDKLEDAIFMHELLATGRTVVVNRHGKAVIGSNFEADEMVEIDLFTIESIKKIKEIFGEEVLRVEP